MNFFSKPAQCPFKLVLHAYDGDDGFILLCSGPGADGPGREHVAADAQKVLVLLLLTERLL